MYFELSRWDHVIRSLIAAQTAVVHGDPMFKVNGTGTHFWLREGQLTPLLTWGGEDGESEKVLLGKTFAHPDVGVNAQWFGEFSIMCKGKAVVEIVAADRLADPHPHPHPNPYPRRGGPVSQASPSSSPSPSPSP